MVFSRSPGDTIRTVIAVVSADSLESTVRGLEAFGTRYFSNANHRSVAAWIRDRMLAAGLRSVELDSFTQGKYPQMNVVGTIPGSVQGPEIVVGGHFDSYSFDVLRAPGADDNASGTAAVIEMARAMTASGYTPRSTVRFVAFAAEEVGLRGGWDYANKAKAANRDIRAMLNFDMIGHRLAAQPDRDYYVVWYAGGESLARIDSSVARTYTTLTPVMTTSYRTGSDSYCFAEQGYRAVFHIERDFSPFYHTPNDLADTLDFDYAAEIARVGLATLDPGGPGNAFRRHGCSGELRSRAELPQSVQCRDGDPVLRRVEPDGWCSPSMICWEERWQGLWMPRCSQRGGTQAVRWAADNVASGVFIGRLSAGRRERIHQNGAHPMTGWCNVCGWEGEFLNPEREREGMQCGNCSASSRHRAVVRALGLVLDHGGLPLCLWPSQKEVSVLESSARGPVPMMLREKVDYYATEFDPAKIAAGAIPGNTPISRSSTTRTGRSTLSSRRTSSNTCGTIGRGTARSSVS